MDLDFWEQRARSGDGQASLFAFDVLVRVWFEEEGPWGHVSTPASHRAARILLQLRDSSQAPQRVRDYARQWAQAGFRGHYAPYGHLPYVTW